MRRFFTKIRDKIEEIRLKRFLRKEAEGMLAECFKSERWVCGAAWATGKVDEEGDPQFRVKQVYGEMSLLAAFQAFLHVITMIQRDIETTQDTGRRKLNTPKGVETIISVPLQFLRDPNAE